MKRNIISIILGCTIGLVIGITAIKQQEPIPVYANAHIWEETASDEYAKQELSIESSRRHITEAERFLLAAIVFAEANTESLLGKQYVVDVIFNRVDDPRFPNCIAQVIYQPYQFWTAGMPTDYDSIPADIYLAIDLELDCQTNTEVLYFRTGNFHNFGTPLFQCGHHFFSK